MKNYLVNKKAQSNGDHEVHIPECLFLPDIENRKNLGYFSTCHGAVVEAKKTYSQSNGCYFCCNDCHTS